MGFAKKYFVACGLILTSVVISFLLVEILYRVVTGKFTLENFIQSFPQHGNVPGKFVPEKHLGWTHEPSFDPSSEIDRYGLRRNLNGLDDRKDAPIMLVGNSFAYGLYVQPNESIAAFLERQLLIKVGNGGVIGYGFDQALLRLEKLVENYTPALTIITIIPHDFKRSTYTKFLGAPKPAYGVREGQLQLLNPGYIPGRPQADFPGNILGYSKAIYFLSQKKVIPSPLAEFLKLNLETIESGEAVEKLNCAFVERFQDLNSRSKLIFMLYDKHDFLNEKESRNGLARSPNFNIKRDCRPEQFSGIEIHDFFEVLAGYEANGQLESLFSDSAMHHMGAKGNALAAEFLLERSPALKSLKH